MLAHLSTKSLCPTNIIWLSAMRRLLPKPSSVPVNPSSLIFELPNACRGQVRDDAACPRGRKINSKKCENCVKDKKKVSHLVRTLVLTDQCDFSTYVGDICRECFNRNKICKKRRPTEAQVARLNAGKRARAKHRKYTTSPIVGDEEKENQADYLNPSVSDTRKP